MHNRRDSDTFNRSRPDEAVTDDTRGAYLRSVESIRDSSPAAQKNGDPMTQSATILHPTRDLVTHWRKGDAEKLCATLNETSSAALPYPLLIRNESRAR